MQISFRKFTGSQSTWLQKALDIRTEVFVNEQHVSQSLEFDGLDSEAVHFLLFVDDRPVATARYRETDRGIKLERFAVLQAYRCCGFGAKLLAFILKDFSSDRFIYFHAQETAVAFYERYGFEVVGDLFYEADIPHYEMVRKKCVDD